jgi:hypothetical protein
MDWLFQKEWDRFVARDLQKLRSTNPRIDYELACLIYYDYDCSQEEGRRRIGTLDHAEANLALDDCEAMELAPKPEGWRRKRKSHPAFPKEWKHEIRDSWEDKSEALKNLHQWTMEKRRKDFEIFYARERKSWETQLMEELCIYMAKAKMFRNYSDADIKTAQTQIIRWDMTWKSRRDKEILQRRDQGMIQGSVLDDPGK